MPQRIQKYNNGFSCLAREGGLGRLVSSQSLNLQYLNMNVLFSDALLYE